MCLNRSSAFFFRIIPVYIISKPSAAVLTIIVVLVGISSINQNPLQDTIDCIKLFKLYGKEPALTEAKAKLARNPVPQSFAKRHNYWYEGVCLSTGFSGTCKCSAPPIQFSRY